MTDHDPPRPGAVLLHPAGDPDHGEYPHHPGDPEACRIFAVATAHATEWPWRRFTGDPRDVPEQWADLSGWRRQSLAEVGEVLGT